MLQDVSKFGLLWWQRLQKPIYSRLGQFENIRLIPPQPCSEFVALMNHASLVLTDAGGVQGEAPGLGKPLLVMRDTNERSEGVDAGTVRPVVTEKEPIVSWVAELLTDESTYKRMSEAVNPYGAERMEAIRTCRRGDASSPSR